MPAAAAQPARRAPFAADDGEYLIRIIGLAGVITDPAAPAPHVGEYVNTYDPEFADGRGMVTTTRFPGNAARFTSPVDALECWRTVPAAMPRRADGQPNRPLCAFTIETVRRVDALAGNVIL